MLLKKAIQGRGQTMKEFAAEMGKTPTHISGINTGRQRPSMDLAKKIGLALGISWKTIIGYQDSLRDSAM